MASAVCLIQGASRGIGLGFCRALLARSPETSVIATCRHPENASDLQELQKHHGSQLTLMQLDVTNEKHVEKTCSTVQKQFGRLDLLINSAGILHPTGRGETSINEVDPQDLLHTLHLNTVGPLTMAKYFTPLLQKGEGVIGVKSSDPKNSHVSVLVNMSAKVGSITENEVKKIKGLCAGLGGWYSYRMSKAALNMATKNLGVELGRGRKKVICISLHPGSVDTSLSRPYHKNVHNLLTVEQSVEKMMQVINSLTVQDSGKFLSYDRTLISF